MSNPGVITLDKVDPSQCKFKRFVIEDNIGECIHVHFDNIRFDFTISEFIEFSEVIKKSLKKIDIINGYSIDSFDEYFLKNCFPYLQNLKKIKIEQIKISDLKCIVRSTFRNDLHLHSILPIEKTPAYRYLLGDKKDFLNYYQYNYCNTNNENRIKSILRSIKEKGYPIDQKYIVLFNDKNIIRDGQHRAAVLAYLYGLNYRIDIMRFYFNGKKHIVRNNISNVKVTIKWLAKKIYRKFKKNK